MGFSICSRQSFKITLPSTPIFDKIKQQLIDVGIPENQIKIKTANKDELKGVDLMGRDCEVRYIITVNALKEGLDCPFAYILATLANKTSKVDVEQILGRILRQPYTTQHGISLLNLSYVFTSSNDFRNTIDGIIRSLQKVGFSRKDFRDVTPESSDVPTLQPIPEIKPLFPIDTDNNGNKDIETELEEEFKLEINNIDEFKNEIAAETVSPDIQQLQQLQQLQQQAMQVSDEYTQIIEEQTDKGGNRPTCVYNTTGNVLSDQKSIQGSCA